MKSLVEKLNEALGDVTPKQFMDIWKGKNISIDTETMNNAAYFSNELCNVHRSKLPTPKEFTNVCEWIIDNVSWKKEDVEKFLIKVMETYLQTNDIATTKVVVKGDDIIEYKNGINFFKNDLKLTAATALFFNIHYEENLKNPDTMNRFKQRCENMFEPAFKKFGVFWDNWPDYSEGFNILLNKFK